MSISVLRTRDHGGVARILNLPDAASAQEPATLAQLQAQIEGTAWKDSARVAAPGNINLAAPGANIDTIAMAANDRVLLPNQTDPKENGIWIWNGAAAAMTRALDANTFAELEAAVVEVEEGATNGGTAWRQTQVNGVIGVNNIVWTSAFSNAPPASETVAGIAELATQAETDAGTDDNRIVTPLKLATWAGRIRKYAATVGDGAATQYDKTHNLNTKDVTVAVYRNSGANDDVDVEISRPDVNTVRLNFDAAPALNAYRVVVTG